ncbi:MAG: T9SS type A sorting domain-containing protein, partial [Bacteroidetes bacterium]
DYNFQQDTAYGPDRFELIVALSSVSAEEHNRMLSSDPFAYKANDETMIIDFGSFAGSNVSLQLYNLNGQRVWACNETGVDRKRYVQDLQPGAYILMMQTSEGRVYQQKMIW